MSKTYDMRGLLGGAVTCSALLLGAPALAFQDAAAGQRVPSGPPAQADGAMPAVPDLAGASPDVTAADLEKAVRGLADDALLGRDTGSPGGLAAARGLAAALEAAGLRPAGDEGFLQDGGAEGFAPAGPPALTWIDAQGAETAGAYGVDFTYGSGPPLDLTLDLVVVRTPEELPEEPRADAALLYLLRGFDGYRLLLERGMTDGRGWGAYLRGGPSAPGTPAAGPALGLVHGGASPPPPSFRLRGPLLQRAADGAFTRVRLAVPDGPRTPAYNVLGVLDGVGTPERPELAEQAVVVTAHYDHVGVAPPGDDPAADLVFNGADDDASGVAAVLELAAALAAGPPPARDVVFLLVTGEEVGLIGTEAYLDRPAAPLEDTVYNLNFEMVGRPDPAGGPPGTLWLTGFERTNVGPALAAAGLAIVPDPHPEQHFFERSDNIAFVRRGVVGQSLSSYGLHEEYHTVRDEADTLDYAHMQTGVRAALAALRMLADGSLDPAWVEGGEPASR